MAFASVKPSDSPEEMPSSPGVSCWVECCWLGQRRTLTTSSRRMFGNTFHLSTSGIAQSHPIEYLKYSRLASSGFL